MPGQWFWVLRICFFFIQVYGILVSQYRYRSVPCFPKLLVFGTQTQVFVHFFIYELLDTEIKYPYQKFARGWKRREQKKLMINSSAAKVIHCFWVCYLSVTWRIVFRYMVLCLRQILGAGIQYHSLQTQTYFRSSLLST